MERILESQGKEFWFDQLVAGQPLERLPFPEQPFVALIWSDDPGVTFDQRSQITDRLVEQRCKYIVCGGTHCDEWELSADESYLRIFDFPEDDKEHVMTTCHQQESVDEVAFFAVLNTNFDSYSFNKFIILQIGKLVPSKKMEFTKAIEKML